jgi:hypothetical protein
VNNGASTELKFEAVVFGAVDGRIFIFEFDDNAMLSLFFFFIFDI